jgi:hypothetical protein
MVRLLESKFYIPNQEVPVFTRDDLPPRVGDTVEAGVDPVHVYKVTGVIADPDGWRVFLAPVSA